MRQITIQIPDTKVEFFLELLRQLGVQAQSSAIQEGGGVVPMQEQGDDMFIPEWHKEIVLERIRKNQNDPTRMLKWEEVCNSFKFQ